MSTDALLPQLEKLLAAIKAFPDPRRAAAEWKQAYALLKKTSAAGNHLDNVIASRNVDGFVKMIDSLRPASATDEPAPAAVTIDDATLRSALKSFRRRLKLMRLDEESRIDLRDPMSKGQGPQITAIEFPREHGPEVWAELVRRGVLRRTGPGLYEITGDL